MKIQCRFPIPVGGFIHPEVARWMAWASRETDMDIDLHESNAGIAVNRNQIVEEFLRTALPLLWMVDGDVVPARKLLHGDHRCLSGTYHHLMWQGDQRPPQLVLNAWKKSSTGYTPYLELDPLAHPVDAVGAGCLLLERSLLEEMEPPWFEDRFLEGSFQLQLGEDLDFCEKVWALGEKVWIEPRYKAHHTKAMSLRIVEAGVTTMLVDRQRANLERAEEQAVDPRIAIPKPGMIIHGRA